MARRAGSYAHYQLVMVNMRSYVCLSGEVRMVLITCKATVGSVSNPDHNQEVLW